MSEKTCFKAQIYNLAKDTDLSNRQIADKIGCSIRLVQHYVGATGDRREEVQAGIRSKLPRILIFDTETSPMEIFTWGLYRNQHPQIHQVIKDWSFLCWSAKWLCESEIFSGTVKPKEAHNRKDGSIIERIWGLFNEADIVAAHNAANFDVRRLNARFKVNGLGPPTPYRVIDTLKVAQKNFAYASHKLEWLCKQLNVDQKKDPQGFTLWVDCVSGEKRAKKALARMQKYCDQDIRALEDLYMELAPWIKSGPNAGVYVETDRPICPNAACGSMDLTYDGYYTTAVSKFRAFRCDACGAVGRERKSVLSKAVRAGLVSPTAS